MLEINDDIFKYIGPNKPLVVTTNNVVKSDGSLVMGAGIAKLVRDKFPGVDKKLGRIISGLDIYNVIPVSIDEQIIIALQTKRHWKDPSPIDLVVESCKMLMRYIDDRIILDIKQVYMTRPGCGNGGLDWNYIKPLISFLDDRFIVCHKE
jgi:hypothetical protein